MSEKNELSLEILREQDIPALVETFNFPWTSGEATQEKWEKYYAVGTIPEVDWNMREFFLVSKFRERGHWKRNC
jgi:hypothetical protein